MRLMLNPLPLLTGSGQGSANQVEFPTYGRTANRLPVNPILQILGGEIAQHNISYRVTPKLFKPDFLPSRAFVSWGYILGVAVKRLAYRFNHGRTRMLASLLFLIERPLLGIQLGGKGLCGVKGLYPDLRKILLTLLSDGRHVVVIRSQISRKFGLSLGINGNNEK